MANSKYSVEWFKQRAAEIDDTEIEKIEQDAQNLRNEFLENYAPDKLRQLSGVELLRRMFINDKKDNNNLSYWLEQKTHIEFGSISGGSAYKFGLFYHKDKKWVSGSSQNSIELSENEAIQKAENIRDQLLLTCEIIENAISSNKSFDTIETYINLNDEFTNKRIDIIRQAWVRKYLFVYFYDKDILPDSYSNGYLKKVLKQIGESCNEDAFVMMGRIKLLGKKYENKYGIPARKFGIVISKIYNKNINSSQVVENEEDDDNVRNYWVAGFSFGGNDPQIDRFVRDGIWEGIGNEKCNKLIESINKDDVIILKTSYTKGPKHNTSCCGIYAVGHVKSKPSMNINGRYECKVEYDPVIKNNKNEIIEIVELIHPKGILRNTMANLKTPEIIEIVGSIIHGDYKDKTSTTEIDLAQTDPDSENQLLDSLQNKLKLAHNLILTGAPGTGKTHMAHEIAKEMVAETEFVQFHPSYDYSDFVEGLRPDKENSCKEICFKRVDGVFKSFCNKAVNELKDANSSNRDPKPYVFIIDEINRGELSKIFGELFFAIEPGYRVKGTEIEDFIRGTGNRRFIPPKTQYQNLVEDGNIFAHGFFIPENLYIIGTMNDIDRSVESMDFAIRRRFNWMEVQPDEFCDQMWQNKEWAEKAKNAMMAINDIIKKDSNLGEAYQIGPAYFLKLDEYAEDQDDVFTSLWENNLKPLIREYLRGIPGCDSIIENIEKAYLEALNENPQENSDQEQS